VARDALIQEADGFEKFWTQQEHELLAAGLTGDIVKGPDGKTGGISTSRETLPEALRARWAANAWRDFIVDARGKGAYHRRLRFEADVAAMLLYLPRTWARPRGAASRGRGFEARGGSVRGLGPDDAREDAAAASRVLGTTGDRTPHARFRDGH
jgi:hypothetical protein